jgi:mannose-6-phosphate isomerase
MFRLTNIVRHYDWGSTSDLPALLGIPEDGRPYAEMWFGAHPSAPSQVAASEAVASATVPGDPHLPRSLDAAVAAAPGELLGPAVAARFGGRLPYLLKLLAAGRPLSLQVHPTAEQARAGFARERVDGVPATPTYRDASHKPELLVALSDVVALAGFRAPAQVADLLSGCGVAELDGIATGLRGRGPADGLLRIAFGALLALPRAAVERALAGVGERCEDTDPIHGIVRRLLECFPGDVGVLAAMLLNPVALAPGQALFVGAGTVHCYVSGLGLEIMAASDNVLRAGLTTKRVDVPELMSVVDFTPAPASVVEPESTPGGLVDLRYPSPAAEFEVDVVEVDGEAPVATRRTEGPRTLVCLAGMVRVGTSQSWTGLAGGESVFVGDAEGPVELAGTGTVAIASVPLPVPSLP